MRFFLPIILIGIALAGFFMYVNPTYTNIKSLQSKLSQYDAALSNSKIFEGEKERLTKKSQAISALEKTKLSILLPNSVDNIRLILELDNTASTYGMSLKDVKYSVDTLIKDPTVTDTTDKPVKAKVLQSKIKEKKDYGNWDLEFSTQGTYANFLSFLNDLEHNLRIVDVVAVDFSSVATKTNNATGITLDTTSNENYKYNFKIKTYWLKN